MALLQHAVGRLKLSSSSKYDDGYRKDFQRDGKSAERRLGEREDVSGILLVLMENGKCTVVVAP